MQNSTASFARELSGLIRDLRNDTESQRRVAEPIVKQLKQLGLARMTLPASLAGRECSTVEALEVYEALAGAEASVGWVAWNNSLPCLFSRYLSAAARTEIFSNPNELHANSTRPSGTAVADGNGYRVSGRWALVSGCELAEWLALMCVVRAQNEAAKPGPPETRLMFVRKGSFEILDTWHVGGLRGTGSHDVVVKDVFVPARHSLSPADPSSLDHPIARVPILATLSAGFAAQTIGVAQLALDTVLHLAKTKITPDPVPDLRDRAASQSGFAELSSALNATRAHLHRSVGNVWDKAVATAPITLQDITEVYSAALVADQLSIRTVDTMYAIGGTTSIYMNCPLERAHRDIHTMARHVIAQPTWLEDAGRVKFGLTPTNQLYAV